MGRATIRVKPQEARVVGKPTGLREVGEEFNLKAQQIVEPALKREIRRRLAKTPQAHKFTWDRKERSPAGSPGAAEIGGSSTERKTRVRVVQSKASGAGGGRGARGASYTIEATSLTQSKDKSVHTFGILTQGRREGGIITAPMSFYGRRGNEGRVKVRPWGRSHRWRRNTVPFIRHRAIKPAKDFERRVFDQRVLGRLGAEFERAVTKVLVEKDRLKDYYGEWDVTVDVQ